MCASQAVVVLVEVHHLHAFELLGDLPYLLLLTRLFDLNTLRIPADVLIVWLYRHIGNALLLVFDFLSNWKGVNVRSTSLSGINGG